MRLADIDEVMEIEPVAFGSHHWSHQSFVNELNNSVGHYFAAVDEDSQKVCGYSGFWLVNQAQEAHITTLAVHPDMRRHYIGERLLIQDIREAKYLGARWITLEVRVSNESAQLLYYKYGFKSAGVHPRYYQDNDEDAMILWTENIEAIEFNELFKRRVKELDALITGLGSGPSGLSLEGLGATLDPELVVKNEFLTAATAIAGAKDDLLGGTNGAGAAETADQAEEGAKSCDQ